MILEIDTLSVTPIYQQLRDQVILASPKKSFCRENPCPRCGS